MLIEERAETGHLPRARSRSTLIAKAAIQAVGDRIPHAALRTKVCWAGTGHSLQLQKCCSEFVEAAIQTHPELNDYAALRPEGS